MCLVGLTLWHYSLLSNAHNKSFIGFIHFDSITFLGVFTSLLGTSLQTTLDGVCAKTEI